MKDKQPQTCYVPDINGDFLVEGRFANTNNQPVKQLESVYIHTLEELEALKAKWYKELKDENEYLKAEFEANIDKVYSEEELIPMKAKWMREAAEKAMYYTHSNNEEWSLTEGETYLNQHYPLPQPINTNP